MNEYSKAHVTKKFALIVLKGPIPVKNHFCTNNFCIVVKMQYSRDSEWFDMCVEQSAFFWWAQAWAGKRVPWEHTLVFSYKICPKIVLFCSKGRRKDQHGELVLRELCQFHVLRILTPMPFLILYVPWTKCILLVSAGMGRKTRAFGAQYGLLIQNLSKNCFVL